MLGDDEALAVLLGLITSRRAGLPTTTDHAHETAGPRSAGPAERFTRRLDAVLDSLAFTAPPDETAAPQSAVLLSIADAIRHRRPILIRYTAGDGRHSVRTVHPFRAHRPLGPVVTGRAREW